MPNSQKSLVVTLTDEALENIQKIAEQLTSKGMHVNRVLPVSGVISGTCPSPNVADLQSIKGVMSVEEEAVSQLPRSGSPIT